MAKEPELLENKIQAFQCVLGAKNVCASLGFIAGKTAYSTQDTCPHLLDCSEPSHFHTTNSGCCQSCEERLCQHRARYEDECVYGGWCESSSHCLGSGISHNQFVRARMSNSRRDSNSACHHSLSSYSGVSPGIWRVGCWLKQGKSSYQGDPRRRPALTGSLGFAVAILFLR